MQHLTPGISERTVCRYLQQRILASRRGRRKGSEVYEADAEV